MYGILFDFNGTMFFDETLQRQSWECFLSERLGRAVADDEFQEYVRGRNAEETFRHFFGREFSREEVAALEEEKERVYRALCLQSAAFCLADGLPHLLDELASRGVPVNIATASGKNNVDFFFRHLGLHAWFARERVAFNDGTVRGKPAPDIYRKAAQNLGMDVRDCIVFEDSKSGIEAAKRAPARKVVGVSSASAPSRLRLWGADEIIADYTRPDEIFEKIGMP